MAKRKEIDKLDFWARNEEGRYYHICEGTGDNLLQEDIEEGYIDYIYYEIFDNLNNVKEGVEDDGGMVLLKTYYQDMTLDEIIREVQELEDVELEAIE